MIYLWQLVNIWIEIFNLHPVMTKNGVDLLSRFNAGSERAFKEMFDDFFPAACSFVARYIPEVATVEDVVQETFIHIWEKRGMFTDWVYFKAYLYRALYNNALYYLRGHRVTEEVGTGVEDDTGNVLDAIITEEVRREIIAAISKLPTERGKIIEMTLAGNSQEEIARELGISVNTVKSQKRKAYAFLREELKNLFALFWVLLYL